MICLKSGGQSKKPLLRTNLITSIVILLWVSSLHKITLSGLSQFYMKIFTKLYGKFKYGNL